MVIFSERKREFTQIEKCKMGFDLCRCNDQMIGYPKKFMDYFIYKGLNITYY